MAKSQLTRVHVWKPAANPATARTLLLLHGTGADENDLLGLGRQLDPEANLLSPRGNVVTDGMARFFVRHDDGTFDVSSIVKAVKELREFLLIAQWEYGFDADSVWAVGFSNGASTAVALLQSSPDILQGIVAFAATTAMNLPSGDASLKGKKVFLANGLTDAYTPEAQTKAIMKQLTDAGADVTLMTHPGGHTIVMPHVQQVRKCLG